MMAGLATCFMQEWPLILKTCIVTLVSWSNQSSFFCFFCFCFLFFSLCYFSASYSSCVLVQARWRGLQMVAGLTTVTQWTGKVWDWLSLQRWSYPKAVLHVTLSVRALVGSLWQYVHVDWLIAAWRHSQLLQESTDWGLISILFAASVCCAYVSLLFPAASALPKLQHHICSALSLALLEGWSLAICSLNSDSDWKCLRSSPMQTLSMHTCQAVSPFSVHCLSKWFQISTRQKWLGTVDCTCTYLAGPAEPA